MKYRVSIVLGTRPEAIKLAPVILAFQAANDCCTRVIQTGQHRHLVKPVMDLFGLTPDQDLALMTPRQSLAHITCTALTGLQEDFRRHPPHLVLVQGDTTTAFAAALAAFYQHVPLAHVEAGLRTDDLWNPYPEEANRRLIGQLAQLHFAPTPRAARNLKAAGALGTVALTGNTVIDALLTVARQQPTCPVPGLVWDAGQVILVTVHRRENWGEPLQEIGRGLRHVLDNHPKASLLLPLHPNPTVREPLRQMLADHPRAFLVEPLDYKALVGAVAGCTMVLTDSGGLQEEAPTLGKPVLVLRNTTERPEAVDAGTARLIGTSASAVLGEVSRLLTDATAYDAMARAVNPFGDGQASGRIVAACREFLHRHGTVSQP
ncbi:non-hydrolyzing UDP-N-acetylglucosamine 2-epimerase [Candidatus Synechococcus spongiarum]|uniref:UDP-N-acetylglucosamine 2-epimerase (non-hydrolyzing) n=1 Tax=Candidatus Synechococcus spongiarum LMB bulk15N TaxID=1943583 RepID=A0A1T1CZP5_9SYNE|nr:UDP-N-acetylglucosamine 2-epimerase (non-hydrolyzing) [Candidatus Synechococcus spongiarum]OOV34057.1 UDP-N-acetylglucosamine 2-epimerase (non-hydrolyzing) [Candidatus Synechococcus spongiarum LMB bulk15N]